MERDEDGARKVDPYHLLFQGGQFYLLGRSHERDALRVFRLSRIRGKVAYATKAEHDFKRPTDFDPRAYAARADWQFGDALGDGRDLDLRAHRAGRSSATSAASATRRARRRTAAIVFTTEYASRAPARRLGAAPRRARARPRPAELVARSPSASSCWTSATTGELELAAAVARRRADARPPTPRRAPSARGRDPPRALRPPRDARVDPHPGRPRRERLRDARRLRAPADLRRRAARGRQRAQRRQLRRRLLRALRRDRATTARSRSTPSPTRDNFARPARLLPVEAKALVAAIDLIGDHLPEGSLTRRAREDRRRARRRPDGAGPAGRRGRRRRLRDRARRLRGDRRRAACCSSTTTRPTRTSSPSASSSPTR